MTTATATNAAVIAVACPIHGVHGNLSNGKCWWCVQEETATPMPPTPEPPVPDEDEPEEKEI